MKIFSSDNIKRIDRLTAERQGITSVSLMERASEACMPEIMKHLVHDRTTYIFCGMGNNGGDGITIGYYLSLTRLPVKVLIIRHQDKFSADAARQYEQLKERDQSCIISVDSSEQLRALDLSDAGLIIDCLFGTGLSRPADGLAGEAIDLINKQNAFTISIDIPSGLFSDKSSRENRHIVISDLCLSFQFPKLAFLLSDNADYVTDFKIINIDLDLKAAEETPSSLHFVTETEIRSLVSPRKKFSHKGTFGHALLVAGSKGKSGAAILSSKACLRSGAGLLTVHSNKETLSALLQSLPEAMSEQDASDSFITELDLKKDYAALGFGPGAGTHQDTQLVLKKILNYYQGQLVIDADGLNILSENKTWLSFLPPSSVLTPHPREFERLTEKSSDDFERLELLRNFSRKYNCIVILKNAHSAVAMPDGNIFFNSTGNPSLAKGGSGDVLTGIILGLMARGYNAPKAALIGTYVHGLAADLCVRKRSMESILASDVIEMLPRAFRYIEIKKATP